MTAINIGSIADEAKARVKRAREIQKELKQLDKDKTALDKRYQSLLDEVNGFGISVKPATGKRRGRPATKNAKPAKSASKDSKRGRATSKTGENRTELLFRLMPGADDTPVSKDELVKRLAGAGYASQAESAIIGVGQALGSMKKSGYASNAAGERGEWRLTKKGETKRDKLAADREAAAKAEAEAQKNETPAAA